MGLTAYLALCREHESPAVPIPVRRVVGSSCIAFNATTFAADFPAIWSRLGADAGAAAQWIVDQTSFLTSGQFQHFDSVCASRHAPGSPRANPMFRQARMGRVSVAECHVGDVRIVLETKGCGVWPGATTRLEQYGNGLLALEAGVKEYLLGVVLPHVVESGADWRFARVYALVLLTVELQRQGGWHPAVMLVREPTIRAPHSDLPCAGSREWELTIEVELALRRRGLTSCFEDPLSIERDDQGRVTASRTFGDAGRHEPVFDALLQQSDRKSLHLEVLNVQANRALSGDRPHIIVDLEHFKFAGDAPSMDLTALCRDLPMGFGGVVPRSAIPTCGLSPSSLRTLRHDWTRAPCDAALYPYLDRARELGSAPYKQQVLRAYLETQYRGSVGPLGEAVAQIEVRWREVLALPKGARQPTG